MTIRDTRIGRRAPSGRITKQPSRYVTNETFNSKSNSAPTYFWLNEEFFVLLPIGMGSILPEIVNELKAIAGIDEESSDSPQVAKESDTEVTASTSEQPPTEVVKAKGGRRVIIIGNRRVAPKE